MQEKIRQIQDHYKKEFLASAGVGNIMVIIIKRNRRKNEITIEDFNKKSVEEIINEIEEQLGGKNEKN